jgi:hypothetical protein
MTPNDRICQAIAGHWKNGEDLEHGSEYSNLLSPFGNKRAVSRHVNKGSPKTEDADREIALAWADDQPGNLRDEILALLGLTDKGGDEGDVDVKVKDEEIDVKQEGDTAVSGKRKIGEVDDAEESKGEVVCACHADVPSTHW